VSQHPTTVTTARWRRRCCYGSHRLLHALMQKVVVWMKGFLATEVADRQYSELIASPGSSSHGLPVAGLSFVRLTIRKTPKHSRHIFGVSSVPGNVVFVVQTCR